MNDIEGGCLPIRMGTVVVVLYLLKLTVLFLS